MEEIQDKMLLDIKEKYSIEERVLRRYLQEENSQKHVMELIVKLAKQYSIPMRHILVVGAGRGGLSCNLLQQGYDVQSIEPYIPYVEIIKYKYEKYQLNGVIHNGMLEGLELKNDYFDIVAIIDVIEHVEDPILSLKKLHAALKENGGVYITVPNRFHLFDPHYKMFFICWLPLRWADFLLKKLGRLKQDGKNGRQQLSTMHYYKYNEFIRLAENLGFDVVDVRALQVNKPDEYIFQDGKFKKLALIFRKAKISFLLNIAGKAVFGHRFLLIKNSSNNCKH